MRHRLTQFISSRSSVFPDTRTWEADPRDDVRDDLRCPLGREQAHAEVGECRCAYRNQRVGTQTAERCRYWRSNPINMPRTNEVA